MFLRFTAEKTIEFNDNRNIDITSIITKILKDKGADNVHVSNSKISFRNTIWKFGSILTYMNNISRGSIDIIQSKGKLELKYVSHISILLDLLLFPLILLAGLTFMKFILLGLVVTLFSLVMRIVHAYNGTYYLLNEIIDVMDVN